jgi:hypothetical protein
VAGDDRYNDQLPIDISEPYRDRQRAFFSKYREALDQLDRSKLSEDNRLSCDDF